MVLRWDLLEHRGLRMAIAEPEHYGCGRGYNGIQGCWKRQQNTPDPQCIKHAIIQYGTLTHTYIRAKLLRC